MADLDKAVLTILGNGGFYKIYIYLMKLSENRKKLIFLSVDFLRDEDWGELKSRRKSMFLGTFLEYEQLL